MDYDFTYTGAEIQAILDTAKKLKDSGYIFLGVATPSTNPGTPTQKVYYEAKQAGTYTNFGGVVLPDGISLLKWNGSWTSETVMCGDGGVFDISVYNSSGGTLATFADLSDALDGGNNIPVGARKGGMSVKFVQSSDNKYVQARLMAQNFTTDVTQWQGVDDIPTAGSENLVKSGGVAASQELLADTYKIANACSYKKLEDEDIEVIDNYHVKNSGTQVEFVENNDSKYYKISVNPYEIYNIIAYTYWNAVGYILADENGKVLKIPEKKPDDWLYQVCDTIMVPPTGKYIYINIKKSAYKVNGFPENQPYKAEDSTNIYKANNINETSFIKIDNDMLLKPLNSFDGFIRASAPKVVYAKGSNGYITDIYEIPKESFIKLKGYNEYLVTSYVLTDYSYNIIKKGSNGNVPTKTEVNAELYVPDGGFLFISKTANDRYNYELTRKDYTVQHSEYATQELTFVDEAYFNDEVISDSSYSYTEIEVNPNSILKIGGMAETDVPFIQIVDASSNVIGQYPSQTVSSQKNIELNIEVPDGAKYMYINTLTTYKGNIYVYKLNRVTPQIGVSGKRWCAIGDSLTAAGTMTQFNYVDFIEKELQLVATNKGVGGTGHWNGGNYTHGTNTFYNRALTLSDDYDIITVFGSFNDLYADSKQGIVPTFGNVGDTGTNTLAGCMYNTIENLRQQCPSAMIAFIAPTPWSSHNNVSGYPQWAAGWAENYVTIMKGVCEKYNIPFLDLYHYSGMYPWKSAFKSRYFLNADGTHPNQEGHRKFIVPLVKDFIKKLL